ncbi:MAG: hypothetical protein LBM09_01505 [Candidatus Nomurabacteria bacterium]|jgi:phosphohistidine swiveling domain-containing protein|nr:hypothetical protein [Candidatus Nomurabacteria bacterium]
MKSVINLSEAKNVAEFGGKAVNLGEMLRSNLPVPNGLAVGLTAFNKEKLFATARAEILSKIDQQKLYAVRSSATVEDAKNASWAGQFESFLNIKSDEIIATIEKCHNSAKLRAKSYADKNSADVIGIAVVIQEMITPKFAGVLFTIDPTTGEDHFVTEYVSGLGESLVDGSADPTRIAWRNGEQIDAPFDIAKLTDLAQKVEQIFGDKQDIEWAFDGTKMWLIQARPITTVATKTDKETYFGEPNELFYWGPSRAVAQYMSDFIAAMQQFFTEIYHDKSMPNPPKTLVLFYRDRMVWLNNAEEFTDFTAAMFENYTQFGDIDQDMTNWRLVSKDLEKLEGDEFKEKLLTAWQSTFCVEFALYGAEIALARRLTRFDEKTRQQIYATLTIPDRPTFINRLDAELLENHGPATMAKKYPWINDGYFGVQNTALEYFTNRLKTIENHEVNLFIKNRKTPDFGLTIEEIKAFELTRRMIEFMDDRKRWMMETRRLITKNLSNVENGWLFKDGKTTILDDEQTQDLWVRYVKFRVNDHNIVGLVASRGGRHTITGEVAIPLSPTDNIPADKILVVPSTSPSYVPLMRNARALVTDHGGIMSHAAIVAREFGLPCIVGTKSATKLLKNGDQVVLDLIKGKVNY